MCNIVNYCENIAKRLIGQNRLIMDLLVEFLLEYEELDGDEVEWILNWSNHVISRKNKEYT